MTDVVQVAIISSATTLAGLFVSRLWGNYNNGKRSGEVSNQVSEVHVLINDRMDQLLKAARLASHAAGMEEGRAAAIAELTPKEQLP